MTDLFLVLGDFFEWSFKLIAFAGKYIDWFLFLLGVLFLVYWCKRIIDFGQKDKTYDGDRL